MKRILINATQQEEIRTAIVDGQKLIDFDIEVDSKQRKKGNIYKGVITRIEPSLNAAFVDYGIERHGFLPFKEISKSYFKRSPDNGHMNIANCLNEGQQIIVQIRREERGNKGAALTSFVSLAGRRLILMPDNPKAGGISRRIDGQEREELHEILSQLKLGDNESVIIRTAGIGQSIEELQSDLDYLHEFWQNIIDAAKEKTAPFLIYQEHDVVLRTLRDHLNDEVSEVLVDNKDNLEAMEEFIESIMPDQLDKLHLYENDIPLFNYYQVESEIETAYEREIRLASGATIVFDHTEALLAIDINSSRATRGSDIEETALKTNLEACEEIARQLRLRDAGGLIVIDFIVMLSHASQREVENELKAMMRSDRARVQIGHISRFGLMEISRQRLRSSLGDVSYIPCPRCSGHGSIRTLESSALAALRMMEEEASKEQTGLVVAHLPVDVTSFLLNEKRSNITNLEKLYQVKVTIAPDIQMETPHFKINRYRKDDKSSCGKASHEWIKIREQSDTPEKSIRSKEIRHGTEVPVIKSSLPANRNAAKSSGFLKKLFCFLRSFFSPKAPQAKPQPRSRNRSSRSRGRYSRQRTQHDSQQRSRTNTQESHSDQRNSSQRQRNQRRGDDNRSRRRPRKSWQQREQSYDTGNRNSPHRRGQSGSSETETRQPHENRQPPRYKNTENASSDPGADPRRTPNRRQRQRSESYATENGPAYGNRQQSRHKDTETSFPDDNIGNRIPPQKQRQTEQSYGNNPQSWHKDTKTAFSDADLSGTSYAAIKDSEKPRIQQKQASRNTETGADKKETSVLEKFPIPSNITQVETKQD